MEVMEFFRPFWHWAPNCLAELKKEDCDVDNNKWFYLKNPEQDIAMHAFPVFPENFKRHFFQSKAVSRQVQVARAERSNMRCEVSVQDTVCPAHFQVVRFIHLHL